VDIINEQIVKLADWEFSELKKKPFSLCASAAIAAG
jgi:hypothetical protein